jgi:hypothetical protein
MGINKGLIWPSTRAKPTHGQIVTLQCTYSVGGFFLSLVFFPPSPSKNYYWMFIGVGMVYFLLQYSVPKRNQRVCSLFCTGQSSIILWDFLCEGLLQQGYAHSNAANGFIFNVWELWSTCRSHSQHSWCIQHLACTSFVASKLSI